MRTWRALSRVMLRYAWHTGHSPLVTWVWRVPVLLALLTALAVVAWTCRLVRLSPRCRAV